MPDERQPIPLDVAAAFEDAMANYYGWRPGEAEPTVNLNGNEVTISGACHAAMSYGGSMPVVLASLLAEKIHAGSKRFDFKADDTYENGARCLLALINYRKEEYRR
jgi:hypothetical protein